MLKQGVEVTLSRGLEQWLWFLGLDVRHPSGNLLVKYGLKKFKSPNNKGSSRYQSEQNGDLIDLHSFFVGIYPYLREWHPCQCPGSQVCASFQ